MQSSRSAPLFRTLFTARHDGPELHHPVLSRPPQRQVVTGFLAQPHRPIRNLQDHGHAVVQTRHVVVGGLVAIAC